MIRAPTEPPQQKYLSTNIFFHKLRTCTLCGTNYMYTYKENYSNSIHDLLCPFTNYK